MGDRCVATQDLRERLLRHSSSEGPDGIRESIVVLVLRADADTQSTTELLDRFNEVGLQINVDVSSDGTQLVGLHASPSLLMHQAERTHMQMQLRSSFDDNETGTPTHRVFTRSQSRKFAQWDADSMTMRFSTLQRQRLVYSLIEAEPRLGGCGINLEVLCTEKSIEQYYAVHSAREREGMSARLFHCGCWGGQGPPSCHELSHYFGEHTAMYFAWTRHYTRYLMGLAPIGCVVSAHQYLFGFATQPARLLLLGYTLLLSFWCALLCKCWIRRAAALAFEWGIDECRNEEPARPDFIRHRDTQLLQGVQVGRDFHTIEQLPSVVKEEHRWWVHRAANAKQLLPHFAPRRRLRRVLLGAPLLVMMALAALVLTIALSAYQALLKHKAARGDGELAAFGCGIINAVFIALMNVLYVRLATWLNDNENWRTESDYGDALIIKIFTFVFVNSYASLFYIAYVRSDRRLSLLGIADNCELSDTIRPVRANCMPELQVQLLSLMLVNSFVSAIREHGMPLATKYSTKFLKKMGLGRSDNCSDKRGATVFFDGAAQYSIDQRTPEELCKQIRAQAALPRFEGTFEEYSEMTIQFGYVCMFGSALPISALIAVLNNVLEWRTDVYKLLILYQRPRYQGADGIGRWYLILQFMSLAALLNNVFLLGYASDVISHLLALYSATKGGHSFVSGRMVLMTCVVIEHILLLLTFAQYHFVADRPRWVERADALRRLVVEVESQEQHQDELEFQRATASGSVSLDSATRGSDS